MKGSADIAVWLPRFIRYLEVERRSSLNTRQAYETDLRQFQGYLSDHYRVKEATLSHFNRGAVRGFLSYLIKNKAGARTVARKLAALRSFARYLLRESAIELNPTLGIATPKMRRNLPDFLTVDETKALLQTVDTETYDGLRDQLILELFYATGIRVSELTSLCVGDVRLAEGVIRVTGKRRKTRLVPFGDRVRRDLEAFLQKRTEAEGAAPEFRQHIFVNSKGNPLTRMQVLAIVKRYVALVADQKKAHPHALRHTFATHMLNEGADLMSVKELLGHENLSTTQIYTHVSAEHLKKIYKRSFPRGTE